MKPLILSAFIDYLTVFSCGEAEMSRFEHATIPQDGMTIWCDDYVELHRHIMLKSVEIRSELELIFDW